MIDKLKSLLLKMVKWPNIDMPPRPGIRRRPSTSSPLRRTRTLPGGGHQPSAPSNLRRPPPGVGVETEIETTEARTDSEDVGPAGFWVADGDHPSSIQVKSDDDTGETAPGAHHGPVPVAERAKDGDSLSNITTDVLEINGLINRVLARSVSDARESYLEKIRGMPLQAGISVRRSDVLAVLGVQHTHKAKYVDDQLLDECWLCGRNLLNEVHFGNG